MVNATKYAPIQCGNLVSDLKTEFNLFKTKRSMVVKLAYGFMFVFISLTIFLAFCPSSNSSSLWFTNIFKLDYSGSNSSRTSNSSFNDSFRSYFPSSFPYLFPSSPHQESNSTHPSSPPLNHQSHSSTTVEESPLNKGSQISSNQTQNAGLSAKNQSKGKELEHKGEILKVNQTIVGATKSPAQANQTALPPSKPFDGYKNGSENGGKNVIVQKGGIKNLTSSLAKKQSNKTNSVLSVEQERDNNLVKYLVNCDLYDGNWVRDESYPLYKPGSCSLIDEQFNCFLNGRPDNIYDKLRWKPKGCSLPRLDGSHMLDMLRGKRLVFVGDSLNRNMWESLVCILRNSVKNKKKVYEASGQTHFRTEASYSFVFKDYKFTVEFFVTPFLVQEWETKGKSGEKKETLRLDMIGESADKYKDADIIIFNTGHWWTHEKTSLGKDYYQEGSHVYSDLNVLEAFRRALTTWGRWVDAHINPKKSLVFFRGYSASHFSGGQWNSGGACDHEIEPIKNETYLSEYPAKMKKLESVLKGMKTQVSYMNITRMTDYRKDGHPSIYRKQHLSEEERRSPLSYQDCSHWCLPGVPDSWNEILYAQLLLHEYNIKQQQQRRP